MTNNIHPAPKEISLQSFHLRKPIRCTFPKEQNNPQHMVFMEPFAGMNLFAEFSMLADKT